MGWSLDTLAITFAKTDLEIIFLYKPLAIEIERSCKTIDTHAFWKKAVTKD